MVLTIGLTGGIGSGKSTVANLFMAKGITIIDTDQLARDLTLPHQDALNKIIETFGEKILLPDKTLNRSLLRQIIFQDPSKRQWLENLLHPLIRREMEHQINACRSPYCIVVIPLLFESAPNPLINRILLVDAPEALQLQRAGARDQLPQESIQAILDSQVKREERLAGADDIISNDGPLEGLVPQVEKLHQYYLSLLPLRGRS